MKLFSPQLQLYRTQEVGQPDDYFVHVITFCPQTNYRADGHLIDASRLSENLLQVTIKVRQDNTLPDLDCLTPVTHTLALGAIAFPGGEGWVRIKVEGTTLDARPGDPPKSGGVKTVSSVDADNKSRPLDTHQL